MTEIRFLKSNGYLGKTLLLAPEQRWLWIRLKRWPGATTRRFWAESQKTVRASTGVELPNFVGGCVYLPEGNGWVAVPFVSGRKWDHPIALKQLLLRGLRTGTAIADAVWYSARSTFTAAVAAFVCFMGVYILLRNLSHQSVPLDDDTSLGLGVITVISTIILTVIVNFRLGCRFGVSRRTSAVLALSSPVATVLIGALLLGPQKLFLERAGVTLTHEELSGVVVLVGFVLATLSCSWVAFAWLRDKSMPAPGPWRIV